MNPKLVVLKEIGKLAAYAFVTVGLAGTTIVQARNVQAAVQVATSTTK